MKKIIALAVFMIPVILLAQMPAKQSRDGMLNINSQPEGVQVWVDGQAIGMSPCVVQVESGNHWVELRLEGYYNLAIPAMVKDGEKVNINRTMKEVEAYRMIQYCDVEIAEYPDENGHGVKRVVTPWVLGVGDSEILTQAIELTRQNVCLENFRFMFAYEIETAMEIAGIGRFVYPNVYTLLSNYWTGISVYLCGLFDLYGDVLFYYSDKKYHVEAKYAIRGDIYTRIIREAVNNPGILFLSDKERQIVKLINQEIAKKLIFLNI